MKFYSEILKNFYDTEAQCREAEEKHNKELEAKKVQESLVSKEKKQLSKRVEECDVALENAYAAYEAAKEKAKELLEKSNQEIADVLNPAYSAVKKAQRQKLEALQEFNRRFGAYTTTYNGEKAVQEFNRAAKWFDEFISPLFS